MFLFHPAPKLYPQDYLLRATILPAIPRWVLPNHLTVLRFLLTPVVIWLMLTEQYREGFALFLVAAFTDALDGSLARVRNQITRWGENFDPLADKFLMGSLFIILALQQFFFTTLLIILIDLSFIIAGWHWLQQGYAIKANIWGKMKMNCQVLSVIMLLIFHMTGGPIWLLPVTYFVLLLAILMAVASLITHGI
ncbi:MAG: CDP-alcohol phosphatidyltransferase family protein [Patescibacteria group bacterium]|nr:CDP-alcohol phosphatidyltransferase family protein [Patescibacteria group bacterium]